MNRSPIQIATLLAALLFATLSCSHPAKVTPNTETNNTSGTVPTEVAQTIDPAKEGKKTETPLTRTAGKGDVTEVQALLDRGANVNEKTESGVTALMTAAGMNHLEVVQLLVNRRADVNARSPGGYTALMSAALNGHAEVVKVLLEKGAEVNAKDISGRTALKYAESKDHKEVIELLKQAGARE